MFSNKDDMKHNKSICVRSVITIRNTENIYYIVTTEILQSDGQNEKKKKFSTAKSR